MNKKLLLTLLLTMTILTAWCTLFPDKKNVAEVIENYSWKLEKCDKDIRQRKLLTSNSYITREISHTWWNYTGTIPVAWNMVLCNRQDITSANLNFINASLTTNANTWLSENLNSEWYLDTINYPTSKFALRNISKNKKTYTMIWDLTIKDITKTISFDLNIAQIAPEYNFTWEVYLDISQRWISSDNLKWQQMSDLIKFSFDLKTKTMTKK